MPNESELHAGSPTAGAPDAMTEAALGPGYEIRDTNVGAILWFLGGLFGFLVVVMLSMGWFLESLAGRSREPLQNTPRSEAVAILPQREQMTQRENDALYSYVKPAKSGDPVHIPVERAMELLAERGIPPMPGPGMTEVDVNSHTGIVVDDEKAKVKAAIGTEGSAPSMNRGSTIGPERKP